MIVKLSIPKITKRSKKTGKTSEVILSLNEFIRITRGSKYGSNASKQKAEKLLIYELKSQIKTKITNKVDMIYRFYLKKEKHDHDNLLIITKFVQDALVKAELIEDDNHKHIGNLSYEFYVDSEERIEIEFK